MPKTTLPVSNELRETLRWATRRLWEICGPRLKRLILFGSQARGEAGPESDMDVLVVLEGPAGAYEEAKRTSPVATKAAAYRDTALSFVHMSEEEFAEGRSPLVWSVRKDGMDLLEVFPKGASPEDDSPGGAVTASVPEPEPQSTSDSSNR
ncbi:nucleotidyltransferase domain-containing protein [Salinibacter ruber]|uniref:nucleotidyltransferase domain-containing protein n=1 Tax=Salinibacter ruber TaxID=146919 RepID=UPI0020736C18|nr:nucleotidyltransferase domain-containing protein [Salinibacter ruber]